MDDLKEFVAHLRNVHFAMVLTAGTILLGLWSTSSDYDKALKQLRDVNQLYQQITSDSLVEAIDKELSATHALSDKTKYRRIDPFIESSINEYFEMLELNISHPLQMSCVQTINSEQAYEACPDETDMSYWLGPSSCSTL